MIFSRVKMTCLFIHVEISCVRAKAHLPVLRVFIVFKKVNILQDQDCPILGTGSSQEVTTAIPLYFLPINLRGCSPRRRKPSIKKDIAVAANSNMQVFCN